MTDVAKNTHRNDEFDYKRTHNKDLLGFVLESILAGPSFDSKDETLKAGGLDDQPFCHSHTRFPAWSNPVYRSRAWTAERIIWHSLHKPEAICDYVNLAEQHFDCEELNTDHILERLHTENPDRHAFCSVDLTVAHIGHVFAASLQSGYRLTWDSNPDYWGKWRYENSRFLQEQGTKSDWAKPTVTSKHGLKATIEFFAAHYEVIDGVVVTQKRHGLADLWFALTHLGLRTIREFVVDRQL